MLIIKAHENNPPKSNPELFEMGIPPIRLKELYYVLDFLYDIEVRDLLTLSS